jgi:hypothetical protein
MSDFELIRDTLARLDPETRRETVEAMIWLRKLPVPVALRILVQTEVARLPPLSRMITSI